MVICRAKDYSDLSRKAANIISAQVIIKPDCVLGLATGASPIGTYEQLIRWYEKGDLDFARVTSINLDEYRGLGPDDLQSYRHFMDTHFFSHINIDPARTHVPDGLEQDAAAACREYDALMARVGPADLQLLGLGHNGHIGFNEPADAFPRDTHCVDLSARTLEANRRFFSSDEEMPRQAYTMGIRSIMRARKIVVVVSGADKAGILREVLCGPITPRVPASVLQLHMDTVVIADEAALSGM